MVGVNGQAWAEGTVVDLPANVAEGLISSMRAERAPADEPVTPPDAPAE